ncbi:hypothetical protein [Marinagarivorans cellulosilyticus]|uniref:Uncharacterized protein n=1 Tax=Marinagarivorans cellulosilyticus TaxID=2721545 RepID=A0AAN1WLL4_9GAMM|nr:hypothetical protein [Marinagarivorans cellulosilyticus]BCD99850.1 hypothetical protein MARGE09_P4052 [Marinagarivorans cellulosilyticus]
MTSKVRIKAGSVEVEFEGSEEYMKDELPALVELLYSLSPADDSDEEEESVELQATADTSKQKLQMTTNTIAAKLNAKKAGDLILAACGHLALVKGATTYSRSNILAEMKLATNYYKATMNKNLSGSLKTLVKQNELLETATDTYALDANTQKKIESTLNAN